MTLGGTGCRTLFCYRTCRFVDIQGWGLDFVGVTAAIIAFLGGRLAGVLYLIRSSLEVLRASGYDRSRS